MDERPGGLVSEGDERAERRAKNAVFNSNADFTEARIDNQQSLISAFVKKYRK